MIRGLIGFVRDIYNHNENTRGKIHSDYDVERDSGPIGIACVRIELVEAGQRVTAEETKKYTASGTKNLDDGVDSDLS